MALATYYERVAIAAAQAVAGFDADVFRAAVQDTSIGIAFGEQATRSPEGRAALDLSVRLVARLYPTLSIRATGPDAEQLAARLQALALAINPGIDITDEASVGITVGADGPTWDQTIYTGCDAWTGRISLTTAVPVGDSYVPFGAGAAACLAASAVFRILLDRSAPDPADATLSCLDGADPHLLDSPPPDGWVVPERTVLVGAGAIGQAATWALARSPLQGTIHVVDHETVEESNLQRYVLSTPKEIGKPKASFAASYLDAGPGRPSEFRLTTVPIDQEWVTALADTGHDWDAALAAVDSASARRAVQAALPLWTANAWTQPGDLGVSDHNFITGACIACLYLPTGTTRNEDEIVAAALGVPELVVLIRTLLHTGEPPPLDLLQLIATRLNVDVTRLTAFQTRGIRDLYVVGICGGAVLPLQSGPVNVNVHVPLAHQSALAGVLLAARLVRRSAGIALTTTEVTRLDIRQDPPARPTQLAAKDPRGICICQDHDYVITYQRIGHQAT
jgi:hypothetical protein